MSSQNKEVNLDLSVKSGLHFLHLSNEISQLWSLMTHQQVKLAYLKKDERLIDIQDVKSGINVHNYIYIFYLFCFCKNCFLAFDFFITHKSLLDLSKEIRKSILSK